MAKRPWTVRGQIGYPPRLIEQWAASKKDAIEIATELVRGGVEFVKAEPITDNWQRRKRERLEFHKTR